MNKEQFEQLKAMGKWAVLNYYGQKLLRKELTREEYDKAIKFWDETFAKDFVPKTDPEGDKELTGGEPNAQQIISSLVKEFGSAGLKDTKEDIS